MSRSSLPRWWGSYPVGADQACRWCIGPLEFAIRVLDGEWSVAHHHDLSEAQRYVVDGPAVDVTWPPDATQQRFAIGPQNQVVTLRPQTADRAVIVRPDRPLGLPTGKAVAFYVSTPVWVEIVAGDAGPLLAVPTVQLSDTWFGPSRMEGELAYASLTSARLRAADLVWRPGRVFTEVRVHNQGADMLDIERVQIPTPHLPLFATAEHALWTPTVTVVRRSGEPLADVRVAAAPPASLGPSERVAAARVGGSPSVVVRALGALWTSEKA